MIRRHRVAAWLGASGLVTACGSETAVPGSTTQGANDHAPAPSAQHEAVLTPEGEPSFVADCSVNPCINAVLTGGEDAYAESDNRDLWSSPEGPDSDQIDSITLSTGGTVAVASVQGGLDPGQVANLVKAQADTWSSCAEQTPDSNQAHPLQILVDPDGGVVQNRWLDEPGPPQKPAACITTAVQTWTWPKADAPSRVTLEWNPTATATQPPAHSL